MQITRIHVTGTLAGIAWAGYEASKDFAYSYSLAEWPGLPRFLSDLTSDGDFASRARLEHTVIEFEGVDDKNRRVFDGRELKPSRRTANMFA